MPYRAVLLLIPVLVLAEAPKAPSAPKKVDQALRQRATEFLQDQVAGNYRKALDLVAAVGQPNAPVAMPRWSMLRSYS